MKVNILLSVLLLIINSLATAQDTTWFNQNREKTSADSAVGYWIDKKLKKLTLRKEYDAETDQLISSIRYSSLKEGLKEGRHLEYYPNGNLKRITKYHKNVPEGSFSEYYENGKLKTRSTFKDGALNGTYEEYHPNGKLAFSSTYKNSLPHGFSAYYNLDGTVRSSGIYDLGKKEGLWSYYRNMKLYKQEFFRTRYYIYDCNLHFRLPDNNWQRLIDSGNSLFNFEKETTLSETQPYILVKTEKAEEFIDDAATYSLLKQKPLILNKVSFKKVLKHNQKSYPLNFKGGVYLEASYSENGENFFLHLIHYVSEKGLGVEVCFAYPEKIKEQMEQELKEFLNELRIIKHLDKEEVEKIYIEQPPVFPEIFNANY